MDEIDLKEHEEKIYQCADSVQREISVFALPIVKHENVICENRIIELPKDCFEPINLFENGEVIGFINNEDGTVFSKDGEYRLKYNAYPKQITKESELNQELDISPRGCRGNGLWYLCGALH